MMITIQAGKRALGICLLAMLATGCSREQQDWRAAEVTASIGSYAQFIRRHPDSELSMEARTRMAQLAQDLDWKQAGSADTADAYREFIARYPVGKWSQEARQRLEKFALPTHGGAEPASDTAELAEEQPVAAAAVEASGDAQGFGVQLGAFSTESGAASRWHALAEEFPDQLGGLSERVVAADTPAGHIYRLQAVVGAQEQARALCEALRRQSQACVAVLPQ